MWIPLARPAVAIKGHKHSFGYKMNCCPSPCLLPQLTGTTHHQWTQYLAITSSNVREQTIRAPCVRPTLPFSGQYCAHCCVQCPHTVHYNVRPLSASAALGGGEAAPGRTPGVIPNLTSKQAPLVNITPVIEHRFSTVSTIFATNSQNASPHCHARRHNCGHNRRNDVN